MVVNQGNAELHNLTRVEYATTRYGANFMNQDGDGCNSNYSRRLIAIIGQKKENVRFKSHGIYHLKCYVGLIKKVF